MSKGQAPSGVGRIFHKGVLYERLTELRTLTSIPSQENFEL